jgi:hypothetical protein
MEKQKKSLNLQLKTLKFKNKIKNKQFFRFRKIIKKKTTITNKNFSFLKQPKRIMCIRLTQNNIFCSFINNRTNKTLVTTSTGIEKQKVTKKSLKFILPTIIYQFFKKINRCNYTQNSIIINIVCPKIYKKFFLKQLNIYCKKINIFINIYHKKCFNGCQVKKEKRKKQKGWKILK